jgi:hypothetical protein
MRLFGHSGRPIPDVNQHILPSVAKFALLSAEGGLLLLALGALTVNPALAQAGAAFWFIGVLLVVGQFGRIVVMAKRR